MRIYEELFIMRPDLPEEEIDSFVEQIKQVVTTSGGTVEKAEKWGIRRLAYRVEKRDEGFYVLLQITAGPESIKELERKLRVSDSVIKFLTVRIDEKLKRIEKRRKEREKRAKRRPAPVVAAPAAPAQSRPGEIIPGKPVTEPVPAVPEPAPAAVTEAEPAVETPESAQ